MTLCRPWACWQTNRAVPNQTQSSCPVECCRQATDFISFEQLFFCFLSSGFFSWTWTSSDPLRDCLLLCSGPVLSLLVKSGRPGLDHACCSRYLYIATARLAILKRKYRNRTVGQCGGVYYVYCRSNSRSILLVVCNVTCDWLDLALRTIMYMWGIYKDLPTTANHWPRYLFVWPVQGHVQIQYS